ncbi:MAG: hypothetical protein ACRELY_05740 [Polyangiaceae bacterium]
MLCASPLRLVASEPARPTPATSPARKSAEPDDELAWIDRAQRALALHPAKARAIIDAYRAAVAHRSYDEEAMAIASEASARVGDRSRALREASALEARFPASAYRDRVLALESEP